MDVRLSRDDLDKLLGLVEAGQPRAAGPADPDAALAYDAGIAEPADGTVLGAFASYFDRGLESGGGMADALSQSQIYGARAEVTDLLRKWTSGADGAPVRSAYLLAGEDEADGRPGLPTLDDVRANFRIMTGGRELTPDDLLDYAGSGQPLICGVDPGLKAGGEIDLDALGHELVSGDGHAGGSASHAIGTIWHRNHNYWVERLREDTGGAWDEDQYFEAARLINAAEYQRVVFTEFAEALTGGVPGDGDGTEARAAIAASAAPLFSETFSFVDTSGVRNEVSLADTFLGSKGQGITIDGVIEEAPARKAATGSDARSQLVTGPVDLAALDGTRGRESATSFNQLRAELFVLTGLASLRPYESWADFQARNNLSDDVIGDLEAAYPEGIDAMDAWVGGLAEAPADGQLGSTLAFVARDQADRLAESSIGLDLLDGLPLAAGLGTQSFADIVRRHKPDADIPDMVLMAGADVLTGGGNDAIIGSGDDDLIFGTGQDDVISGGLGSDVIYGGRGDDVIRGHGTGAPVVVVDDDAGDHFTSDGRAGNIAAPPAGDPNVHVAQADTNGSADANSGVHIAGAGTGGSSGPIRDDDVIWGGEGDDRIFGEAGDDEIRGDAGDDELHGGRGNDVIAGGAGDDYAAGGSGNDVIAGDAGDDTIYGGSGNDTASGGEGSDTISGGSGDDDVSGGAGSDYISGGEGNDWLHGDDDDEAPATPASYSVTGTSDSETIIGGQGGDLLAGGNGKDVILGGAGTDVIDGGDHADTLDGGSGDDVIDGGRGNDLLSGGSGNDLLRGGSGNDEIYGGTGNDRLEGGSGSNRYVAGEGDDWIVSISGSDTIVLQPGFGNDVVAGFEAESQGSGLSGRIDVSAYGFSEDDLGTLIQVLAQGDDTIVTVGTDTLTLLSVNAQTIDRNDFIF